MNGNYSRQLVVKIQTPSSSTSSCNEKMRGPCLQCVPLKTSALNVMNHLATIYTSTEETLPLPLIMKRIKYFISKLSQRKPRQYDTLVRKKTTFQQRKSVQKQGSRHGTMEAGDVGAATGRASATNTPISMNRESRIVADEDLNTVEIALEEEDKCPGADVISIDDNDDDFDEGEEHENMEEEEEEEQEEGEGRKRCSCSGGNQCQRCVTNNA